MKVTRWKPDRANLARRRVANTNKGVDATLKLFVQKLTLC